MTQKIPKDLQGILWSVPIEKMDLTKDRVYIIHQVLMYGNFDNIRWLFSVYPKETIKKIFINHPQKIYTPSIFNFVRTHLLDLQDIAINQNRYVNTVRG